MILLLGSSGYIGSEFKRELEQRQIAFKTISKESGIYDSPETFEACIASLWPELVINCAAFIPHDTVSLCDKRPGETIRGNVLLPAMLTHACQNCGIPLAHISTGCLWNDRKEHSEDDPPQRAFDGYCGFYVGTKVLAEEVVRNFQWHYIWRIRLPFDEFDCQRNYLTKLGKYPIVWDQVNSVSHRGDFVKACIELWQKKAPFGTYNVVNEGAVRSLDIVQRMRDLGLIKTLPQALSDQPGACQLSIKKLKDAGVKMRTCQEAIEDSLQNWKPNNL